MDALEGFSFLDIVKGFIDAGILGALAGAFMPILVIVAIIVPIVVLSISRAKRRRAETRRRAEELGLRLVSGRDGLVDYARLMKKDSEAALLGYDQAPQWVRSLSDQVGIELLEGERDGVKLIAYEETTRSGSADRTFVVAKALLKDPLPYRFMVQAERGFVKVAKLLGLRDMQIGEEEFDRKARIAADDQAAAYGLLSRAPLKNALLDLFDAYPSGYLDGESVAVRIQGSLATVALDDMLNRVVKVAKEV